MGPGIRTTTGNQEQVISDTDGFTTPVVGPIIQPLPQAPSSSIMPYVITEACIGVKDKSCVDVCPVDCIYEGEQMLFIHPDECIDCGACEPECPVTAIFPEEDVPGNLKQYIEKNREVFQSDTPPGRPTK
jgi:ferredoxin